MAAGGVVRRKGIRRAGDVASGGALISGARPRVETMEICGRAVRGSLVEHERGRDGEFVHAEVEHGGKRVWRDVREVEARLVPPVLVQERLGRHIVVWIAY